MIINPYSFAAVDVPIGVAMNNGGLSVLGGWYEAHRDYLTLSGSNIIDWRSRSGGGLTLTQSTDSKRPTVVDSVINGRSVARFDGSNDAITTASNSIFQNVGGGTIFAVAKSTNTTANYAANVEITTPTGVTRAAIFQTTTTYEIGGRRLDANGYQGFNGGTVSTSDFKIFTGWFDFTNSDINLRINGTSTINSTSFQTDGSTSNTASTILAIGGGAAGSFTWPGDIAEVIIYRVALSSGDRASVEGYLNTKYGTLY